MNPKAIRWLLSVWVLGLCLGLVVSMPVHAQVSGATLSGSVTDPQGGSVPNAKVSARNVATGVTTDTETNGSGLYTLPNLNAGDYEISVTAQGFSTAVAKLTLTVGQKQELNMPLAVGQVEQSVQVTTEAPQVELESSTMSGEVNSTTVRELPLNGRDWASLATLQPSVTTVRTKLDPTHVGTAGRGMGNQLTINGARPEQNSYRLDGAIVNDYSNAGPGSVLGANLGVDAIQEFNVLTSNYSAEYGFTSGGVVNAITKSGTNSFHGTGFDFIRNDIMDARNFFTKAQFNCTVNCTLPKNNLQQNQFGVAAGYRILKDKLFLFGNYEGVRKYAGLPVTGGTTLSTNARNGIIANETEKGGKNSTTCAAALNCDLYANGAAQLPENAVLSQYLALYPIGNDAQAQNQNTDFYNFLGQQKAIEDFVTGRGDYKISGSDSLFATYVRDYSTFTSPTGSLNDENALESSYRQAIIAEETHVFSAAWVNTFRVAEDRTNTLSGLSPASVVINPAAANLSLGYGCSGVGGMDPFGAACPVAPNLFGAPGFALGGATGVLAELGGASTQSFWGQIFQVYDDAFHQAGSHGLKFGGTIFFYQVNGFTPLAGVNGSATFSTGLFNPNTGLSTPTYAQGNNLLGAPPSGCTGLAGETCTGAPTCYVPAGSKNNTMSNGGVGNNTSNYDSSCSSLVNFFSDQPMSAGRPFDSQEKVKNYLRDKIVGVYFQDDYKVKRTLTLNLGVRYEPSTIPTLAKGNFGLQTSVTNILPCGPANVGVVPTTGTPNTALTCPEPSVLLANIQDTGVGSNGLNLPGVPYSQFPAQAVGPDPTTGLTNKWYDHNPTLGNIEPRIGFAWDVFGDGKTSIRGGWGVFDSLPLPYILILNSESAAPNTNTHGTLGSTFQSPPSATGCTANQKALFTAGYAPDTCFTDAPAAALNVTGLEWPYNVVPAVTAGGNIINPLSRNWWYVDNAIKRNYIYQFNFSLQRQLTSDTTITIAYAGSRGYHEPFQADTYNTALPVNIGHPIPGIGYYWPGCTAAEMGTGPAGSPGQIPTYTLTGVNGSTAALPIPTPAGQCSGALSTPNEIVAGNPSCSAPLGCSVSTTNNIAYEWIGASNQNTITKAARYINPSTSGGFNTMWQTQSWYDSMQVNVIKRMGHGFQIQGAYTWSKSLDDSSGSAAGDTFQLSVVSLPWYDLGLDKGPSEFNVAQNLVINGTWLVPTPKNWGSLAEHLAGGWEIGGIFTAGTGVPEQPVIGTDILGEGVATANVPQLLAGCSPANAIDPNYRNSLFYYKVASSTGPLGGPSGCLGLVPQTAANTPFCDTTDAGRAGTFAGNTLKMGEGAVCPNIRGNLGRDIITGPGLVQLNASIFKNNYIPKISESFNIQFRAEFFNVLNHTNFSPSGNSTFLLASGLANTVANSGASPFGAITSTQGDNRIIQLALKVVW